MPFSMFDNVCMYMIHVVLHALKNLPQTIYFVCLMATANPESGIEMEDLPDDEHAHDRQCGHEHTHDH